MHLQIQCHQQKSVSNFKSVSCHKCMEVLHLQYDLETVYLFASILKVFLKILEMH